MTTRPRLTAAVVGMVTAISLAACTAWFDPSPPESATPRPLPKVETSAPDSPLTVIADEDAVATAIATSTAVFASSPAVIVGVGDDAQQLLTAASASVALGVPMLLAAPDAPRSSREEPDGGAADPVAEEVERLDAGHVVVIGGDDDDDLRFGDAVVSVPVHGSTSSALAEDVARVLGITLAPTPLDAADGVLASVARLDAATPQLLLESEDSEPGASESEPSEPEASEPEAAVSATPAPGTDDVRPTLPHVPRGEALRSTVVVAVDEPAQLAAVATARAAGATVTVLPAGVHDVQASPAAIEALHSAAGGPAIVVGAAFATRTSLDWEVRAARTGAQLPGGGQRLFPGHLLVLEYGMPGVPALGILGEQPLAESVARAKELAAAYVPLTSRTVMPAFEIITTLASGSAGDDGDYSTETDVEELRPWVEEAGRQGMYVVLDLQPGRSSFPSQLEQYRPLLEYPWVGLALDPEWRLAPDQHHLVDIGQVDAAEVNQVIALLAEICDTGDLPPKLLVLHQFRTDMILNRELVDVTRSEVTVLIHADGQGSQPAKQDTWRNLHENAPAVAWGWKNFYDEDAPMLTPEQTMQVQPPPDLVSYQ
ncbi:hypothetical protein ACFWN7_09595 [Agromyces sp. NPDC058484]|uniref:hypothetical protein n=1 Tax=Agromyces sp. NPDC058484 TaxID=3346524 RepID=UPI00365ED6F9